MPLPWGALTFILKQAPILLAAADALVERTRGPSISTADLESLRQRIADLEQHQQANAALARDLADHANATAAAVQASAARARQAFVLAMWGVVLGATALLVAWLR
jgi:hypothetical protein